jgi:acyl-coenzyme A synthetase/AMP-(fatty) acid ligase
MNRFNDLVEKLIGGDKNNLVLDIFNSQKSYNQFIIDLENTTTQYEKLGLKTQDFVLILTTKDYDQILTIYAFLQLGIIGVICDLSELEMFKVDDSLKPFNYILKNSYTILHGIDSLNVKKHNQYELICLKQKQNDYKNIKWAFYTSGSSGDRKLIGINENNILTRVESERKILSLNKNSRILNFLNFTHELGFYNLLCGTYSGSSIVINNILSSQHLLDSLIDKKITSFISVPKVWMMLNGANLISKISTLQDLRSLSLSGGAINLKIESLLFDSLPSNCKYIKTYGQTETSRSLVNYVHTKTDLIHLGGALKDVTLRLGEDGELIHSGLGVMAGLYNNKKDIFEESVEVHTGDIFENTEDGKFKFVDRIDSIVKINDVRISLAEIEKLISTSCFVTSVACLFVEKLYVFCTLEKNIEKIALKKWLEISLPKYIEVEKLICMDVLPTNISGKISYNKLKEVINV